MPLAGEVADGAEAFGGEEQQEVGAGGGGTAGGRRRARHENGGGRAALDGQVGEAGVDERHPEFGDGGPVQGGRPPLQPFPYAAHRTGGTQGRHPLECLQVVGGEGFVGVPVLLAAPREQPVPPARPEEGEQQGGAEGEGRVRLDEGDGDEQQRRNGAGDERLGQIARDVRVDSSTPSTSVARTAPARAPVIAVGPRAPSRSSRVSRSPIRTVAPAVTAARRCARPKAGADQDDGDDGGQQRGEGGRLPRAIRASTRARRTAWARWVVVTAASSAVARPRGGARCSRRAGVRGGASWAFFLAGRSRRGGGCRGRCGGWRRGRWRRETCLWGGWR